MYELVMKSRWYVAALALLTLGSIVAYVSAGDPTDEAKAAASRDRHRPVAAQAEGQTVEVTEAGDDELIDKAQGTETRPSVDPTPDRTPADTGADSAEDDQPA